VKEPKKLDPGGRVDKKRTAGYTVANFRIASAVVA
jgi:hypothetical protein